MKEYPGYSGITVLSEAMRMEFYQTTCQSEKHPLKETLVEGGQGFEMNTKTITIASDFSEYPAGRFRWDGDASGEAFREDHLIPALSDKNIDQVVVVFDGVPGLAASFLEEAFGGLVSEHGLKKKWLKEHLSLEANEPGLGIFISLAWRYVERAGAVQ